MDRLSEEELLAQIEADLQTPEQVEQAIQNTVEFLNFLHARYALLVRGVGSDRGAPRC